MLEAGFRWRPSPALGLPAEPAKPCTNKKPGEPMPPAGGIVARQDRRSPSRRSRCFVSRVLVSPAAQCTQFEPSLARHPGQ